MLDPLGGSHSRPRGQGVEGNVAFVAVVGGGIAGLASAWRLRRAGHQVCVFERSARVGGRMWSERRGRFALEPGAACFARSDAAIHRVAGELGLGSAIRPWARARDRVLGADGIAPHGRDGVGVPRLHDARRALRTVFVRERDRRWRSDAQPLDPEPATSRSLSWLPALPDATLADLRAALLLRDYWPGAQIQSFAGGVSTLTEALAATVAVKIGWEVGAVETDTAGAQLRLRERDAIATRVVDADAVVVAVPATRVARLCPKLTPEERGFFEQVRYAPATVVYLAYDAMPSAVRDRSLWIAPSAGLELSAVIGEHHRPGAAPVGRGLVRAVLRPEAAARMWRASDASVADLAVENLALLPGGLPAPLDYAVFRFTDGVPRSAPEDASRLARFHARLDRSPRLVFAGDGLAGPTAEAALASGLRAAAELESTL